MSTMKHDVMKDKDQNVEKKMDWSYIEWVENEVVATGVVNAETQTDREPFEHKECQTSSPVLMHMALTRTHSKLRHPPLLDHDGMVAPFFQFDRQAPGRISTSPTLRRMRSTRRPVLDSQDPARMGSTQEEPSMACLSSPLHRVKSPLAAGGQICHEHPPISSCGRQRTRSHRSKTFDNGIASMKPQCRSAHPTVMKGFGFPDSELQEKEQHPNRLEERRRSSVVVSLPGLDVSPGDLFVSNGAADILNNFSDTKKSKWPFSRRSTTKGKSQTSTSVSDIEGYLSTVQIQDWRNSDLQKYKDYSVAEFLQDQSSQWSATSDPLGFKRQEAIWELFTSECVYFLDQLMVLKEVFLATLTNLQMRTCLADIDAWRLFANLSELCLVSFGFLNNLLRVIKDSLGIADGNQAALLELLSNAFQQSICHSLQKYCLNYSTALLYLDSLKPREDFGSYVKWCEGNNQCRRLQLRDLLVAPLQRLTRYPLLLRNIARRFRTEEESKDAQAIAEQVDMSICDLEGKVKWLDNYQKVKQLRDALVWLPVWERDKRAFIPETVKHLLKPMTLENLISHRSLLHEGKLVLIENAKLIDVYVFLFDEFLLITKIKRNKKRSIGPEANSLRLAQNPELDQLLKEGCTFTVLDQPVSLDRLQLRNIDQFNASTSGLPHSFIITHQNRYQQCIGAFVLQAASEASKRAWLSKIEEAVSALLKLDSQHARVKYASLWLESSQI
ncbi:pleckstrin homology domain-containing family G member 7 [Hippocampus comes]|uniref:pleckstrin homology domain-containing family G member 7 n=1 Tax=Hippocampus comes TaxID=109280 RepID=UPI00094EE401|nr:PREDICTED: pleckstrin homology domain-containing family G member 7 [Hippocampus comes]XP_019749512.1 PREDICTED: pleckstrin homology domain-containing family G member 7 [Hippocampus comes]XP_019749513.1 PREDICTED: pleckstrin homology domain-containing family G member 7 [Hippocampus comes]